METIPSFVEIKYIIINKWYCWYVVVNISIFMSYLLFTKYYLINYYYWFIVFLYNNFNFYIHVYYSYNTKINCIKLLYYTGTLRLCSFDEIEIYLGLIFDNHLDYEDLRDVEALQKYSELTAYQEPMIVSQDDMLYRTWWPNKDKQISIEVVFHIDYMYVQCF